MKCKNCQFTTKRRGISSVVGALLFVVLMVATFAVLGVALNSQTDIVSTGRDVAEVGLKKQQEDFVLNSITQAPASFLKIELTNRGQNAAEMFTVVMTNTTDAEQPTRTFEIPSETSFLAPGDITPTNIVATLDLKLDPAAGVIDDKYDFKVISSLGTIKTLSISCDSTGNCGPVTLPGGPASLNAQLFLDGPNGVNSKTSTMILFVTNTGSEKLDNVAPNNGNPTPDCDDMWEPFLPPVAPQVTDVSPCVIDSPTPVTLAPGQSTLFKWDATILGDVDDEAIFCNQASAPDPVDPLVNPPITSPLVCDSLTVINPNDCGGAACEGGGEGGETIILIDDLLIRPSIFMVIPSPMGEADAGDQSMFGIQVVNPTNATITVNKVILSVYAPGAQNNDKLFYAQKPGCEPVDLSSFTGFPNNWSCPGENQAMWKKTTTGVPLPPYSVETFMAKFRTNGISSACCDVEGVLIQASVFTTFGSFGKGNYQTTMSVEKAPLMSLYMSPVVDSRADADIQANRQNINYTDTESFNIVLADMDTNIETWLQPEANFVINIPRDWTLVGITGTTGIYTNATEPMITVHGDGSTQIIAHTDSTIGKCQAEPCPADEVVASTISFDVIPPNKNFDRLYIMYVLADGLANIPAGIPYDFSSGPLNEIVLQVNSNSTGP